MTTSVQQLVDEVLEAAQSAHPGVEFDVTLSDVNALFLPKEADKLFREVGGRTGYYRGHVYRDCLVTGTPSLEAAMIDHLVIIAPVIGTSALADQAQIFYGDLRTGTVGTELPPR